MLEPQFIHLRLHSEYSIVDGLVRIDDAVDAAVNDGQPALALTDLSNLFGLIKFYKASRRKGIKPIAGCDVWISNDQDRDKPFRLLLLVKNRQGYLQLCELLSRAWLENQHKGRAEVRIEWLEALQQQEGSIGLIALSGAHTGDIGVAIDHGHPELAEKNAQRWAAIFPDSFYIEIQRIGQEGMEQHVYQAVSLAVKLNLPVVATHPVQFISQDEFSAHEARTCISSGEILSNSNRSRLFNDKQSFLTQAEMAVLFADMPGALQNSVEIAKRCNLTLELGKPRLPDFPTPDGMSIDDFLFLQAKQGLEERLVQLFPSEIERKAVRSRYEERLQFEADTIINMGFAGYFLIVADFIRWAKNNGVPVGPGRGSGAGSLVAYSLHITDLDPLAYNLLFERFLNPERVSMPDFDIDFCQHGRDRVIQYVKDKYGKDAVSQIATFGTMAAKAAVRDVGRVLNFGYNFCDGISKLIPFKPGKLVTIADAKKEEPLLAEREESEEEVKQLLALAEQVEGLTRNVGMHAGGVLIAPSKLTDFCPLYTQGGDSGVVSHFDKADVEEIGLVKFDFLGLTTLTILDLAVHYVRQFDPALADLTLEKIPLNDRATYDLLTKAKTVAVFQLESRGMQGMLKDARPDRFEDIIALVALYRPGPMDLIPDFCRRKHGERFAYPDSRTEEILSETYGIMVYQEQVMQMAQVIGGYTLGGADLLRRAMGKKDAEEMANHRQIFRNGAEKNDLTESQADEIFDLMEKFAGYGFNKSHAAAYALLAYQTAYLKAHHPAEFMAANLSLAMDDTDKIKVLVEDAVEECGLTLLPPDINFSSYRFMPVGEPPSVSKQPITQIRYGLGAIRGSGESAIESIVEARKAGPFKDLFDFCMRIDKRQVNRRTIDSLIRAGAFDGFGADRAILLASVELALDAAEQAEASRNQASLFGGDDTVFAALDYVKVASWSERQKLTEEKSALGFCLSGHLFDAYSDEARQFVRTRIRDIQPSRDPKWLVGVIANIRTQMSQRGRMLVVTLDDGSGTVDVTIYSELLEEKKNIFKEDEFLAVSGKISEDRFSGGWRVTVENAFDITGARIHFGRRFRFSLPQGVDISKLKEILLPYASGEGMPVVISYRAKEVECELALGDEWRIMPSDECKQTLTEKSGISDVRAEY